MTDVNVSVRGVSSKGAVKEDPLCFRCGKPHQFPLTPDLVFDDGRTLHSHCADEIMEERQRALEDEDQVAASDYVNDRK